MKITKTKIKGLLVVQGKNHYDNRGFFKEIFKKKKFGIHNPIFWCMSKSKKNVLRGLHLQTKNSQEKFVSVIKGKILDVIVDLRKNSKTFGKHFKIILSEKNAKSILIPSKCAHGFLGLDKENIVLYSNNNYRNKESETGILWNDKKLKINWPRKKFLISKKDKNNLTLVEFRNKNKI
jgi:dTDP-4-dehydrorhamnose 3,5-epimerase